MTDKEAHIINGCLKGDRKAQKLLFEEYQGILFGICLRYAKNEAEAEDFLQEGLIVIYKNLYMFRPKGSFRAWLKKVMINSCLQIHKKKQFPIFKILPDKILIDCDPPPLEEEAPISQENLLKYIQQLPDIYRTIFNLHVIEGYDHEEISQILAISKGTSKSRLSRAKKNAERTIGNGI